MTAELTDGDSGKTVVSGTKQVGVVTDVNASDGIAYVDPDWDNVHEGLRETLGWTEGGGDRRLDESAVATVRNGQVRLRDDL